MKKWIKKVVALSFIVAQFLIIPNVSASSLEEIQSQKKEVQQEVNQVQKEVNARLEEVSEISIELDQLNNEIEEHKQTIVETEKDIEEQEIVVAQRFEYTAEQLQSLQKNEVNNNILLSILQAESFTDLVNTIYSASVLTSASEDRLNEAQEAHDTLEEMRETLLVEKEVLDEKQVTVVEQKEVLDAKVAELQNVLAANQEELNQLNAQEDSVRQAIAEKEAAEKRATEARNNAKTQANNSSSTTVKAASSQKSTASTTSQTTSSSSQSSSTGSWMTMNATGYSTQQKGLSTHTAMGIDLRVNPRVIAVDPRVIPLGTLVEVQGLGVYIAGDTGGAIKGNKIDIHYSTVREALNWGRRNVKVRIVN